MLGKCIPKIPILHYLIKLQSWYCCERILQIKLRLLTRKTILTWALKSRRAKHKKQRWNKEAEERWGKMVIRERKCVKDSTNCSWLWGWRRGPWTKECEHFVDKKRQRSARELETSVLQLHETECILQTTWMNLEAYSSWASRKDCSHWHLGKKVIYLHCFHFLL